MIKLLENLETKKYIIEGIFATIGEKNHNNRIYPKELWIREVAKFQDEIAKNSINTLMEWEHPSDRIEVRPANAVAKITHLWIENEHVMGKAVILDGYQSQTLKSLIDNGVQISVSSRSTGEVDQFGNVIDFKLITFDIVGYPSDQNATMYGNAIFESLDQLDKAYQKLCQKLENRKFGSFENIDNDLVNYRCRLLSEDFDEDEDAEFAQNAEVANLLTKLRRF